MRAIIIEEDRFTDLTATLDLECRKAKTLTPPRKEWDQAMWEAAMEQAYRQYHFHFVRWAQSHGASCVRT